MDADKRQGHPGQPSPCAVSEDAALQVVRVTQASDVKGECVMGLLCSLVSAMPLILEGLWNLTV